MMGKKMRKRGSRGKKFINKYKEMQEKIKVQRSNQEYSREYEYERLSTIGKSTEEGGQQGDEINDDGFQTHFEAKVLEKNDIEGNFENDMLGMKFKECMEIKECKDMEKVDLQESMLEYFELEEENEFQVNDIYNENDDKMTPQQVQNFQKDRPSVIQETRGASLCNPVDLHVYETKKSALQSTEAAIILKTAHETGISWFKLCKNTVSSYPAAGSIFLVYSDSIERIQDYKADGYRYSSTSGGHSVTVPSVHPNFRKRVNQRLVEGKTVDLKRYIFRYEPCVFTCPLEQCLYTVIHYVGTCDRKSICDPHGNHKKKEGVKTTPFVPSEKSVLIRAKTIAKTTILTPREYFHGEFSKTVNELQTNVPRSQRQVNDIFSLARKSMISKDTCNMIRYLMIETDFVVTEKFFGQGEAAVTCVSEFAILEVIYFVKHGIPIVFYYDTKYNIGNYWVSALTFRHPDFDHKGTTPIIPIAFLLHTNRSADSHEELFMVLMKKAPSINSPRNAFVSDREKGIEVARNKIFPLIQPAHCWLHFRINAKHALQKMGATKGDIKVVQDDILQLLRSKNIDEYNQIRTERLVKWSIPALKYFQVNLEPDMLKYDCAFIVSQIPDFNPVSGITNNTAESFNAVMKRVIQQQRDVPMDRCILGLLCLDDEYYTHVSRGYKGIGDYRLLEKAHKEYIVHIKKEEDPVESRKEMFLRMVQEVDGSDSFCEKNSTKEDHQLSGIVDIAEALWRKGHVTFCNENQVYLVSNLTRKKINVVTPRTETITVRGNKIVTKGNKRKSLVEVYDCSCDFGISACPCKLAVLRSQGHDLVAEKSNIQLKTLKNVKVRSKRYVRPGIKSSLTIQDCYNIKPAADSVAAHNLSFTSDSDNEVASLKKTSEYQSRSSDGDHNSKVAKHTEDIQFVKIVKKRKHCPTQPVKPRKMARRRNIRFEATPSTIPTSICHGYAFTGPINDLYDEAKEVIRLLKRLFGIVVESTNSAVVENAAKLVWWRATNFPLRDTDVFTFFFEDIESLLRPETWLKTEMVSYLVNLVTSSCVSARTIDIYTTFNLTNIDALKSYPETPRERFSDVSHDCSVLFVPLCVNMGDISDRERKNHFILGICDFSRRTFYLLDSLKPLNRTQGRQVLSNLKYLMDGFDKRYIELELGSCRIAPQVDSSSCGLFVVKYAQDYANGITYLGSALSADVPSPSKYKRSKGRSTLSHQKVIDLYNDDTEMANMKTVELMNKYRNELAVQVLESLLIKNRMASCYNCREQIPENMQLICKNCKAVACSDCEAKSSRNFCQLCCV